MIPVNGESIVSIAKALLKSSISSASSRSRVHRNGHPSSEEIFFQTESDEEAMEALREQEVHQSLVLRRTIRSAAGGISLHAITK